MSRFRGHSDPVRLAGGCRRARAWVRWSAALLAALTLGARAAAAAPAPLLHLHVQPSQVEPGQGTATLEVRMTVEGLHVAAGQPLLTHQNMAPAMTGPVEPLDLAGEDKAEAGDFGVIGHEKDFFFEAETGQQVRDALVVSQCSIPEGIAGLAGGGGHEGGEDR